MKPHFIFILTAALLFCGCDRQAALERARLQAYTNIPVGTPVTVQIRVKYSVLSIPPQPDSIKLIGEEYIFEGISDDSAGFRRTNDTKTMYFQGSMIESITPKTNSTPTAKQ
jgi:hypothetical protein